MDDPLSAVDPVVGRELFSRVVRGRLSGSTRLLVTHQVSPGILATSLHLHGGMFTVGESGCGRFLVKLVLPQTGLLNYR